MKIVITDAQTVVDELVTTEPLREFGEVIQHGLLKYEEVAEAVAAADMIICNKTLLNAHSLRLAKKLRYIGLFATGYNNIDIPYCQSRHITVCNAGSYSTNAVAQHTFALILAHYNKVAQYDRYVQEGRWKRSPTFSPFVYPLNELAGKTIGIVGLGAIGQAVARIALAFGMRVLAYNRHPRPMEGVTLTDFDTLLRDSDIVTVHCPLNEDSKELFNHDSFGRMKAGALFVNTARGGVMVEKDLRDALESDHLGGACIDTLNVEPMEEDCILMQTKNCLITPHIAWAPVETRLRLMGIVAENIRQFLNGTPIHVVS